MDNDELEDGMRRLALLVQNEVTSLRMERLARLVREAEDELAKDDGLRLEPDEFKALVMPAYDGLEVKALDDSTLQGYACVYGNLDLTKDIIESGACAETLAEAKAFARSHSGAALWPLCWQHDKHEVIGGVLDASETSRGLLCTFKLDTSIERGRQAYNGLKHGYLSFSIGYRAQGYHYKGSTRYLSKIGLAEVSAVTFPANPEARALAA